MAVGCWAPLSLMLVTTPVLPFMTRLCAQMFLSSMTHDPAATHGSVSNLSSLFWNSVSAREVQWSLDVHAGVGVEGVWCCAKADGEMEVICVPPIGVVVDAASRAVALCREGGLRVLC